MDQPGSVDLHVAVYTCSACTNQCACAGVPCLQLLSERVSRAYCWGLFSNAGDGTAALSDGRGELSGRAGGGRESGEGGRRGGELRGV